MYVCLMCVCIVAVHVTSCTCMWKYFATACILLLLCMYVSMYVCMHVYIVVAAHVVHACDKHLILFSQILASGQCEQCLCKLSISQHTRNSFFRLQSETARFVFTLDMCLFTWIFLSRLGRGDGKISSMMVHCSKQCVNKIILSLWIKVLSCVWNCNLELPDLSLH
jgi:hypothetical protein